MKRRSGNRKEGCGVYHFVMDLNESNKKERRQQNATKGAIQRREYTSTTDKEWLSESCGTEEKKIGIVLLSVHVTYICDTMDEKKKKI